MKKKHCSKRQPWSPESEHRYAQHRIERALSGNQPTLKVFAKWLARTRGLEPGTFATRLRPACWLVDAVTARAGKGCASAFRTLSCEVVEELFVCYGKDHGIASRRSLQAAMRLFLSFATELGWVAPGLVEAVPKLRSYQLSGLPRGVSDEELEVLLTCPWDQGHCPLRDRAIIYLLATYGVRRGQVSALQLKDLDWRARTIEFMAHKGGKAIRHTLTAAVAETLSEYLLSERPVSCCGYLFLCHVPPHQRLNPSAITMMVRTWMVRCGLPARSPHTFRHAFATRLLRANQSMKAISDLLGHRSLDAVVIYAKVDFERLLECAVDWPEVRS